MTPNEYWTAGDHCRAGIRQHVPAVYSDCPPHPHTRSKSLPVLAFHVRSTDHAPILLRDAPGNAEQMRAGFATVGERQD